MINDLGRVWKWDMYPPIAISIGKVMISKPWCLAARGPSRLIRSCGRCIYTLRRLSSNKHNWGGLSLLISEHFWAILFHAILQCFPNLTCPIVWNDSRPWNFRWARPERGNSVNSVSWRITIPLTGIQSIQSHADSMFLECVGVSQPPHAKNEFWLVVSTYPSEKWWSESQLGWWNSQLNGKS